MPPRIKKIIGSLVLIVGLVAYIFAAAMLGVAILPDNVFVQAIYYAVAGIAWALPVRGLIIWMNRPAG